MVESIKGVTINRSDLIIDIPDWAFYIPVFIGIALLIISIIIAIAIKKVWVYFAGGLILCISIVCGAFLSHEYSTITGYEYNVTINDTDDLNTMSLYKYFDSVKKNDDGTYTTKNFITPRKAN